MSSRTLMPRPRRRPPGSVCARPGTTGTYTGTAARSASACLFRLIDATSNVGLAGCCAETVAMQPHRTRRAGRYIVILPAGEILLAIGCRNLDVLVNGHLETPEIRVGRRY